MADTGSAAQPQMTICGLSELCTFQSSSVSHVLSILDPNFPDPQDFSSYGPHRRLTLRFHDIFEPIPGQILPELEHMETLLRFGQDLRAEGGDPLGHLLVHCHMGISRSTAAMTTLMAQGQPERSADDIFATIVAIRPQAWPNSRMIAMADELLGRRGAMTEGLRKLYRHQIEKRPELIDMLRRVGREREIAMAL